MMWMLLQPYFNISGFFLFYLAAKMIIWVAAILPVK